MTKVWFITGTSRGFGKIWAQAALRRGDSVAATARELSSLGGLVGEFSDAVLPIQLDVTDREGVFSAVERTVARFGRIDVVVNNAGYGQLGMVEELTERELREQMEANFFGAVWVTQAVLPVLRRQGGGRLLQISSEGGVRAYPGIGAYHASKWALEGLSESLRQEVGSFGISVTCVEPGPYATDWFSRSARHSSESADYAPAHGNPPAFEFGDPNATCDAIFELVDTDEPPARLLLGRSFPEIEAIYLDRLETWRSWQPVAERAFQTDSAASSV